MKIYPTARPYIGVREERYVLQALRSGVLSIGPFIERFEKAFAKRYGVKYACAVSSGTAALHLALLAAGIREGDEVITSPYSFVASANAILYVGAKPIFADIDARTYNIDPRDIERRITKKTKAIMPIHIFGQPADMSAIMRIAKKHKLLVIEDACESLLSEWKGKKVGTFGKAGTFAFYPNKQMTTGEGGMIVTNDASMDALCRSMRNQGRGEDAAWLDHPRLGFNYRMDELSAAVGLAQIENIHFLLKERAKIAAWYTEFFKALADDIDVPYIAPHASHTWFVYVLRLKNGGIDRDAFIQDLARRGVRCRPYLPSIHLFQFYRKRFGFAKGDLPVSEAVSAGTFAIPFYIGLKKSDVRSIVRTIEQTLAIHEKKHV
ncbi:DegT/DnrJ/EryC1/StrS family aminotransferase [Candidatus Kaiserbacteria bacterium]|nr:DegT/DnrJ/EryC1/StrS family aminotransferase [Candidatus Kaiserbacteria bacterium]